jgi:pyruvyl transferase EpsO
MPQSVHYREDAAIARGRDCLARHRDLHVFARDHGSLSLIRDHLGLTGARLAIDSAFFLGPIVRELAARCPPPAEREIRLLRSDAEQGPVAAAVRVTGVAMDWCNPDTSSKPTDDAVLDPARAGIDGLSAFDSAFDRRSWRRLCGAVQMLSRAEYLVTDRLHAHILASMLGIPHTLYDNSYGKNAGFYRCWTAGSALASFMDARSPP